MLSKDNHSKNIHRFILSSIPLFLSLCFLIIIFIQGDRIKNRNYSNYEPLNSVFISMYDIENYSEEVFATYRGHNTAISYDTYQSISDVNNQLENTFSAASDKAFTNVFLGIDPYLIYDFQSENTPATQLNDFSNYIVAHPSVSFEILLPYPAISYWSDKTDDEINDILSAYKTFVNFTNQYDNVACYFIGSEEWLIANPANYTSTFGTNQLLSEKIVTHIFCEQHYRITSDNAENMLQAFKTYLTNFRSNPVSYPDLSEWTLVFWGDSIFGNHNGSYSLPGIMNGLSNATVYNYAIGGTKASDFPDESDGNHSFSDRLDDFLTMTPGYTLDDTIFSYNESSYNESKLVFMIHYGFNDFLENIPAQTDGTDYAQSFYDALSANIARLKNAYPQATIIIIKPYLCNYFYEETIKNDIGLTFSDYENCIAKVSTEQNIQCINSKDLFEIDSNNYTLYFEDCFHQTEQGRFVMATGILKTAFGDKK